MSRKSSHRKVPIVFTVFLVCAQLFWAWNVPGLASDTDTPARFVLAAASGSESKMAAPDFELSDLNGSSVQLSKFKGNRPVLLYFWATWCPYCIEAKPQITKLRERIGQEEMEILGINVGSGDSLEKVKKFQEGHPVKWPILYDKGSRVAESYRVQGIPLFVLVDKEGKMVYRGNSLPANPKEYLQ